MHDRDLGAANTERIRPTPLEDLDFQVDRLHAALPPPPRHPTHPL
jgi:hypothetical protein